MATDYQAKIATMFSNAKNAGKTTVLSFAVPTTVTADPTTGQRTENTPVSVNVDGILDERVERYAHGDLVELADMVAIIPAKNLSFTPIKGMKISTVSQIWTILELKPLIIAGLVDMYTFFLKR